VEWKQLLQKNVFKRHFQLDSLSLNKNVGRKLVSYCWGRKTDCFYADASHFNGIDWCVIPHTTVCKSTQFTTSHSCNTVYHQHGGGQVLPTKERQRHPMFKS